MEQTSSTRSVRTARTAPHGRRMPGGRGGGKGLTKGSAPRLPAAFPAGMLLQERNKGLPP